MRWVSSHTNKKQPLPSSQPTSTAKPQQPISNQPIEKIGSIAPDKEQDSPFSKLSLCVPFGEIPQSPRYETRFAKPKQEPRR